jgi:hypothetical protein
LYLELGIELDPDNKGLWAALRAAEEASEEDKKHRYAVAAQERAHEEELLRQKNEAKRKAAEVAEAEKNKKNEEAMLNDFLSSLPAQAETVAPPIEEMKTAIEPTPSLPFVTPPDEPASAPPVEAPEEDLLEGFFSELSEVAKEKEKKKEAFENAKHADTLNEKYTNQDLGTPLEQYHRLTCRHYEFKNQNPYYVLQLDIDATIEDIKYRSVLLCFFDSHLSLLTHSLSLSPHTDIASYLPKFIQISCVMSRIPDLHSKR